MQDLKLVYRASTLDETEYQLEVFAEKWDKNTLKFQNLGEKIGQN